MFEVGVGKILQRHGREKGIAVWRNLKADDAWRESEWMGLSCLLYTSVATATDAIGLQEAMEFSGLSRNDVMQLTQAGQLKRCSTSKFLIERSSLEIWVKTRQTSEPKEVVG